MSPDEIAATLEEFRVLPRWQHPYVPWALATISPTHEGSDVRVVFRPAMGRLLYLAGGLLVPIPFGIPWWFVLFAAITSHVGSLWLGFRPEVEQLEGLFRNLIRGRWKLE